jgi:hypothetical protein
MHLEDWKACLAEDDAMVATAITDEYLDEVRRRLCSHCIARVPGTPPCGERGVGCGVESHLTELIEVCQSHHSRLIDPYADAMEREICTTCELRETRACPCPMKYLLPLAVEAIEEVDRRRRMLAVDWTQGT